jgi:hypothetical protein
MIGVAVAAVGLLVLRVSWGTAEVIVVRRYSKDWRPWNRGHEVRVRLDADRLRAYGLSKDDAMKALTPSRMVDPQEPPPPPGVVFVTHRYGRPDQWENVILRVSPDGESIVRIKDVAKVEVVP